MRKSLRTAFILFAICGVSALLLAVFNNLTAPRILAFEERRTQAALEAVALGAEVGGRVEVEGDPYVTGRYSLEPAGMILSLKTNGYGGRIDLLACYGMDGTLRAARVVGDSETPSLGKKAEEPSYMDKFIGKSSDIPTDKAKLAPKDAEAVSGASMTFAGISKALKAGSAYVAGIGEGGVE